MGQRARLEAEAKDFELMNKAVEALKAFVSLKGCQTPIAVSMLSKLSTWSLETRTTDMEASVSTACAAFLGNGGTFAGAADLKESFHLFHQAF